MISQFARRTLAILLLVTCGCASTARRPAPSAQNTQSRELSHQGSKVSALLSDTAHVAARAGAGELQQVALGVRRAGETLDSFVLIPPGRCALSYARAGASVVDVDLHAYADDGTQFGADEAPDALPTLILCAKDKSERLFLSAKVAQGHGLVAVGLHDLHSGLRDKVLQAVGAQARISKYDAQSDAWPMLSQEVALHLRSLGGVWTDQRRVALPVDARMPTRIDTEVPAERCLSVLILPDEPFLQLDAIVSDTSGRIVSRIGEFGERRFVVFCAPDQATKLHLDLRPQLGQGIALVAFNVSTEPGTHLDIPAHFQALVYLGDHPKGTVAESNSAAIPLGFSTQSGEIYTVQREVMGCKQFRIIQAANSGRLRAKLRVFDQAGHLLAQARNDDPVPLTVCHRGKVQLEVEAEQDAKELLLTERRSPGQGSFLDSAKLASSRVLHRAQYLVGYDQTAALVAGAQLNLSGTQTTEIEVGLAGGRCHTFAVGVGDEDGWVDMRLLRRDTREILARGWGRSSAGLGYCSTVPVEATLALHRDGPTGHAVWVGFESARAP